MLVNPQLCRRLCYVMQCNVIDEMELLEAVSVSWENNLLFNYLSVEDYIVNRVNFSFTNNEVLVVLLLCSVYKNSSISTANSNTIITINTVDSIANPNTFPCDSDETFFLRK